MKIFKWDEINGQDQEVKMEAFLSAVNDTYAILQLKDEEETRPMHFISYAALQKSGDTPDIDHYEVVYVAPLLPYKDQNTLLDEIYEKFNIAHPADFRGHSLSVSDIVKAYNEKPVRVLFAEVPGVILQIADIDYDYVDAELLLQDVVYFPLGHPVPGNADLRVAHEEKTGLSSILESLLYTQTSEGED